MQSFFCALSRSVSRLQVFLRDPHLTIHFIWLMRVIFHLNAPNLRQWLCFLFKRLKISPDYLFLRQQAYRTFRYCYCFQIICCVVKDSFTWYEVAITVRVLIYPLSRSLAQVSTNSVCIASSDMSDPELEFLSEEVSIPEFRDLSSIEENVIEHVPSSGSVSSVLLIHLNSPEKTLSSRSCFSSGTFSSTSDSPDKFFCPGC